MQNRASQKTRQKYSVGPQKGSATNSAGADQTMYFSGPFLCTFYLTNTNDCHCNNTYPNYNILHIRGSSLYRSIIGTVYFANKSSLTGLDIYLTATTPRHLTRQLNYVTSIVATQLSHFLS